MPLKIGFTIFGLLLLWSVSPLIGAPLTIWVLHRTWVASRRAGEATIAAQDAAHVAWLKKAAK